MPLPSWGDKRTCHETNRTLCSYERYNTLPDKKEEVYAYIMVCKCWVKSGLCARGPNAYMILDGIARSHLGGNSVQVGCGEVGALTSKIYAVGSVRERAAQKRIDEIRTPKRPGHNIASQEKAMYINSSELSDDGSVRARFRHIGTPTSRYT